MIIKQLVLTEKQYRLELTAVFRFLPNGNEQGFTYLEMLLVLAVLITVLACSIPFFLRDFFHINEYDSFAKQFELDVFETQQMAKSEQQSTTLTFLANRSEYQIQGSYGKVYARRKCPINIQLAADSSLKSVTFQRNGSVLQFGTFRFQTDEGEKEIVLHIGRGRVDVKK